MYANNRCDVALFPGSPSPFPLNFTRANIMCKKLKERESLVRNRAHLWPFWIEFLPNHCQKATGRCGSLLHTQSGRFTFSTTYDNCCQDYHHWQRHRRYDFFMPDHYRLSRSPSTWFSLSLLSLSELGCGCKIKFSWHTFYVQIFMTCVWTVDAESAVEIVMVLFNSINTSLQVCFPNAAHQH